jgi:hypothetical protein
MPTTFTLGSDPRFHVGATITCYRGAGGIVPASPIAVTSAVVAADSTTTFTGLDYATRYLAGLSVTGPFVAFATAAALTDSGSTVDESAIVRACKWNGTAWTYGGDVITSRPDFGGVLYWFGGDASTDEPTAMMGTGDLWYPASE